MGWPTPLHKKIQNIFCFLWTALGHSIKTIKNFFIVTKKQKFQNFSYFIDWPGLPYKRKLIFFVVSQNKFWHTPQKNLKAFYIYLKTGIFKILLYLSKPEISKKRFIYLSIYLYEKSCIAKKHQLFFIFLHFRIIFIRLN